jgi:hypothetical protein
MFFPDKARAFSEARRAAVRLDSEEDGSREHGWQCCTEQ